MSTYVLSFHFAHGGGILWGANDAAQEKYGFYVDVNWLPLSKETIKTSEEMIEEYRTSLDWNKPNANMPIWHREQERSFRKRSKELLKQMSNELGHDYKVTKSRRVVAAAATTAIAAIGFRTKPAFDGFRDALTMVTEVDAYFSFEDEGTNYSDFVYHGNHIRLAIGKNWSIITFFPLGNYTPNFYPEKLKEVALSAEPYEFDAPETKVHDSKDAEIQARRKATFAREILEHHYGTKDVSKWV